MKGLQRKETSYPVNVDICRDQVTVTLRDGRVITSPLALYPWLATASATKQTAFELSRYSIDWPDLGEGIDIGWLMRDVDSRVSLSKRGAATAD